MNFWELKKKALEKANKAAEFSASKLASSSLTISKKEELDKIVNKSKNTSFEWKTFTKKSIVIVADEKSDFFKECLYALPVLATKWFSQNIPVKLAKDKIEWVEYNDYKVKEVPSLVVFENEEVSKVIEWKEKILKLVKILDLDINKTIESL